MLIPHDFHKPEQARARLDLWRPSEGLTHDGADQSFKRSLAPAHVLKFCVFTWAKVAAASAAVDRLGLNGSPRARYASRSAAISSGDMSAWSAQDHRRDDVLLLNTVAMTCARQ